MYAAVYELWLLHKVVFANGISVDVWSFAVQDSRGTWCVCVSACGCVCVWGGGEAEEGGRMSNCRKCKPEIGLNATRIRSKVYIIF